MSAKITKILFVIAFLGIAFCNTEVEDVRGRRILVLIDNLHLNITHSHFLNDLRAEGYDVDVKTVNSISNKIKEHGEYLYDHIILFCTSESDPRVIKPAKILEFFDAGKNVLIAGDIDTSKAYRQLFNNFGVDVDELGSKVVDNFNNARDREDSIIKTDNFASEEVFGKRPSKPLLYRGVGLTLTNYENFQVWGIVRGSQYAYSRKFDEDRKTLNVGQSIVLVAAVQGRNNARAVLTGSLDMFSNELYDRSEGANREYVRELLRWNLNEQGVLRVGKIYHHKKGETEQPPEYKITDDVIYWIEIEEWNQRLKKWTPYVANDIQMEFVMLDPYVRMPLVKDNTPGSTKYIADFKLPDKYGVFQFKITYRRPGYSFLSASTKIPVRPFKHNEYDRYLFQAYPYYIGVFGTIASFFIFFVYFLYDGSTRKEKDE